jgi:hypothetical protein
MIQQKSKARKIHINHNYLHFFSHLYGRICAMYIIRVSPDSIGLDDALACFAKDFFPHFGVIPADDPNSYSSGIIYRSEAYQYCSSRLTPVSRAI